MSARAWPPDFEVISYRTIGSIQYKEFKNMNEETKMAWIDEENKIVSFQAIDNGEMIRKTENLFWDFLFGLTSSGYRVM